MRFIDPDGMEGFDVIITGLAAVQAFEQLQASVKKSLTLSIDKLGKLSYTRNRQNGKKISTDASADQLINAIDDHSIIVNVDTSYSKTAPTGEVIVGGVFLGNDVSSTDGKTTVTAHQQVNPGVLEPMDTYFNKPGASTLHEVTEAYQGGLLSKSLGRSSGNSSVVGSVFSAAHNAATPQSGIVTEQWYDASGNETKTLQNTVKIIFSVQQGANPRKIIMTYP